MAESTNTELVSNLISTLKLRADDITKFKVSKTIVPVIETNPKILQNPNVIKSIISANNPGSATTVYAVDSNRDFWLCGFSISAIKDATSDVSDGLFVSLQATINSAPEYLLRVTGLTLTAQSYTAIQSLNRPIKIDKGSSIFMAAQSAPTVGKYWRSCTLWGFYE